jgi:cation diffusion facilitator CzcD-associated flavoprotein CzcO
LRVSENHFDVLIVGAGLSGIGAGYHLQAKCPNKTYAILEARDAIGGTWDLFRYPGIRSDSDMYTLGYSFRPWTGAKAIADGPAILDYVRDTAREHRVDQKIKFRHKVLSASWSSDAARWSVEVLRTDTGEKTRFTCGFLFMCSGYYDYDGGYTPDFPGVERFRGRVVHPQKWTSDVDYENKRVVVIGSGATAVTLVPEMAKLAAKVTMLQRSPSYILSMPGVDPVASFLRARLPEGAAYEATRWKNVMMSAGLYGYCRAFPEHSKKLLVGRVTEGLKRSGVADADTHFTPRYAPWDERLCLVPDGDLFKALKRGRADVVTDHIDTFDETGLALKSGNHLDADLIVTATGLKLMLLGGMTLTVDGRSIHPRDSLNYKGTMLSDVPNMAMALGYTNASWTLKADLVCEFVCRLLGHMDREGYRMCTPRIGRGIDREPLMPLRSGYVQRALADMPGQGSKAPWKLRQNYVLDMFALRFGDIKDPSLEFRAGRSL